MYNNIDDIIHETIEYSDLDKKLCSFFLSKRPAVIYGAGNQAQIIYEFCILFRKHIEYFLTTNLSSKITFATNVTHNSISSVEKLCGYNILLAVNEKNYFEIKQSLKKYYTQNFSMAFLF